MNFLPLLPIFSTLIERLFPDKEKAAEAQIEMQKVLAQAQAQADTAEAEKMKAQADVIKAELSRDSFGSGWRSYLMLICTAMVANYYIITPILNALLSVIGVTIATPIIPAELWTLITIGLGGYIGKDALKNFNDTKAQVAKTTAVASMAQSPNISDKAMFDVLRSKVFNNGMTQEQVTAVEDALRAGGYKT